MSEWKEYDVEVLQEVRVAVDVSKFTPEFMADFREQFYDFYTVEEHIEHLAQLAARGVIETPCFIEGYGDSPEFGINITLGNCSEDVTSAALGGEK